MRRLLDCFYAPYAALVLVLLIPPVCLAVILGPTLALRRETGRLAVRLMLLCIGVPLRVRGLQHLPAGSNLVVCNHASYLDGIVLTAVLPRHYSFVVQDGAGRWPLVGQCLSRMGVVFVNRSDSRAGAAATRSLMRKLHAGEALTVFAEGTFEDEAGLLPFKLGAFLMAARCGAPVVPAAIRGSRRLYGGGRKLPRWQPLEIHIAPPLHPEAGDHRTVAVRLRERVREQVLRLCGEPDRDAAEALEQAA
ncbi:1-acyl-sn-glycerol-3-phosphate acyltransferases [Solimonas aquatica]|uniref:1-acyl-sn-glycerol-3-phosphate acyltransferases n=1 Tax=Solimonas aquatica TaxID=489703 RepID=A0A1H9MCK9_9GAMM|nr:lysophospholipid acyltransferase family protein [Solimonas aquatica]SER21239.1 1-acyl-sn-glycerol-3-phosphate acyltransferases [Solimonas aquatica]